MKKNKIIVTDFACGRDINHDGYLCDVVKASDGNIYLLRMKEDQANGWNIGDDITAEVSE